MKCRNFMIKGRVLKICFCISFTHDHVHLHIGVFISRDLKVCDAFGRQVGSKAFFKFLNHPLTPLPFPLNAVFTIAGFRILVLTIIFARSAIIAGCIGDCDHIVDIIPPGLCVVIEYAEIKGCFAS